MMVYNNSQRPDTPSSCKHKRQPTKSNNCNNKISRQNKNKVINKRAVRRIARIKPGKISKSNKEFLLALGFKI